MLFQLILVVAVSGCSGHRSPHTPPSSPSSSAPATTAPAATAAQEWLTTPDGSRKLSRVGTVPMTTAGGAAGAAITVDDSQRQQRFWGVGASITGASASLLAALPASQRDQLMQSLFGRPQGAGLAVLRQPLGANDFSIGSHTYDDTAGLGHFSLGPDATTTLPLVRRAQQLNPAATVVATPWSAPAWMKSNHALIGGTLDGAHYAAYAQYLARTVQAYQAAGIRVGGLSVQNEPSFSPPGYPGMTLTADQQAHLLQQFVRPALDAAGLRGIGLWALDDDYDRVADADRIVHDAGVRQAIAGVAFHCYRGSISAMADFHRRNPGLPLAISECTGGDWSPNFGANLRYDVQSLLIDGIRAGASWVTKWNVALDPHGGPTNGGCTDCRGVVTIDPVSHQVTYNEAYFALGHLGRFVTPGAYVLSVSGDSGSGVQAVAFGNPDGSHALLAFNAGAAGNSFTVTDSGRTFRASLPAGAVATFTW